MIAEDKLREELDRLDKDKSPDNGYGWVSFYPGCVRMDGHYTVAQLRAIIDFMEKDQALISSNGSSSSSSGQTL